MCVVSIDSHATNINEYLLLHQSLINHRQEGVEQEARKREDEEEEKKWQRRKKNESIFRLVFFFLLLLFYYTCYMHTIIVGIQ